MIYIVLVVIVMLKCFRYYLSNKNTNIEEIPAPYRCPITMEVMKDPVIAADGVTYEREYIQEWFIQQKNSFGRNNADVISPLTGKTMVHTNLTPNIKLRQAIEIWKETNNLELSV